MTRRSRKTSTADDIVEIIALLPWWGALLAGLLGCLLFHRIASGSAPAFTGKSGELGGLFASTMMRGLATAGQFLWPLLSIVAADVSAGRRRHRNQLFEGVATSSGRSVMDGMSWSDFERLVGEAYRRRGYEVVERGGSAPDGGVDLVLRRDGGKHFVQCKQWKVLKVGVDVVRQLKGVMATQGARGGFIITSGQFTPGAIAFARQAHVELVDGSALHALIRGLPSRSESGSASEGRASAENVAPPPCPRCGAPMVERVARQGAAAGRRFRGCSTFPVCRGTRERAARSS